MKEEKSYKEVVLEQNIFWNIFEALIRSEQSRSDKNLNTLPDRVRDIGNLALKATQELMKDYEF